jgi:hypothetical protein
VSRLLSVALTEQAVIERRKFVTRRLGWRFVRVGDHLTLVRKSMGRRRRDGTVEPLVRLGEVRVVSVRREPLNAITVEDVRAEGFGSWVDEFGAYATNRFVGFFCGHMNCDHDTEITRIEWEYLSDGGGL